MNTQKQEEILKNFKVVPESEPVDPNSVMMLPSMNLPGMRVRWAYERGIHKNILLKVHGGLGDQICAGPTLRFVLDTMKELDVSLLALTPELFYHLPFKKIFSPDEEFPAIGDYFIFDLFAKQDYFILNFIKHEHIHCVDFSALVGFQSMVPNAYREIQIYPPEAAIEKADPYGNGVVLHPGLSWQSRTMPTWWWNKVIFTLKDSGIRPIIIGKKYHNATTIEGLEVQGCIDLRDKMELMETIALLQSSKVVLTNDSSPLHMAASGDAWIGYITVARRPEYLTHTRHGQVGWRMENLSLGGIWEQKDVYLKAGNIADIGDELRDSWLPTPESFAEWAISKL